MINTAKQQGAEQKIIDALQNWINDVRLIPIGRLLFYLKESAEDLAEQLGKEINFSFEGENILVDPRQVRSVVHNLIHLVRNGVDHGIEFPDERGDKSPRGTMVVRVLENLRVWKSKWKTMVVESMETVSSGKLWRTAIPSRS